MPELIHISEKFCSILVWKIEEEEAFFKSKIQFTSFDTQELQEISHPLKRLEWLASRYLIKKLLNKDEIVFLNKKANGKPIITNFKEHISITHTNGYAASIHSKNYPVSIDLEQIDERVLRIERKFMSESEIAFIPVDEKLEYLILCWSAKETVFKYLEISGIIFKEEIIIQPFSIQRDRRITIQVCHAKLKVTLEIEFQKIESNYLTWLVSHN